MMDNLKVEKDPGTIYPTPDPLILFNFFINIDITLPIRSKGVNIVMSFVILIDEAFPDLSDLPDIEPMIIDELKR